MKAVILAAGKGTNLSPITTTRPLPMIGLAGSTLFDNTLDLLKKSGINDVFVVVGHQKEKLIARINDNNRNGLNLHYIIQSKNEAIGRAVLQAKSKISPGEYFLLIYGDTITSENLFAKAQQSFHTFKCPIASICLPPSNEMFGNVFLNAQMKITQIIEKPKGDNLGNYVLSGAFVLPESFFSLLEKNGRNMEKALKSLVAEGNLMASMWEDGWLDIVYPWHILEANKMLMDSWNESSIAKSAVLEANVTIQGVAHIAEGAVIKAGAVLEGPCSIGEGSYIGNNSLIRSYTSLGANCSVGYGVELKNCVILDRTRVGRLSFIGDSVLGENVDFGAGSMTVNRNLDWTPITVKIGNQNVSSGLTKLGAFVGDNVVVGAGNMIKPGTSVAPGKILPACYSVTD